MNKEYAIWGIPPIDAEQGEDEMLLKSLLTSELEVESWLFELQGYGCTALRVQTIDFAKDNLFQDFIRAINI